jgi:hypothetical protein
MPMPVGEISPALMPEQLAGHNPEVAPEKRPELGVVQAEAAQVAMPALPTPIITTAPDPVSSLTNDDQTAADVDLIEKEWVDKAKKIIAETRDDPYRREREISKLQIEYVRKRYGRVIGDVGD